VAQGRVQHVCDATVDRDRRPAPLLVRQDAGEFDLVIRAAYFETLGVAHALRLHIDADSSVRDDFSDFTRRFLTVQGLTALAVVVRDLY
jgi:hypothetical protein